MKRNPANKAFSGLVNINGIRKNKAGMKFGRLTVLGFYGKDSHRRTLWLCVCECGNEKVVIDANIKKTESCGCLWREKAVSHGMTRSPTYRIWHGMRQRCNNPNNPGYKNYGARGIKECDRWQKFENFLEDMGERPAGKTLERRDNNQGYSKSNCRWATAAEQMRNTRRNVVLTGFGETKCLTDWALEFDIDPTIMTYHLKQGRSLEWIIREFAVNRAQHKRAKLTKDQVKKIRENRNKSQVDLGKEYSVNPSTISYVRRMKTWKDVA